MTIGKSEAKLTKLAADNGWTVETLWHAPDGPAGGLRFTRGTQIANVIFRDNGAVSSAGQRRQGMSYSTWMSSKDLAALLAEKGD
jgi:hypothetical protein